MWMKRQKNLREHIINEKPNTKAIIPPETPGILFAVPIKIPLATRIKEFTTDFLLGKIIIF